MKKILISNKIYYSNKEKVNAVIRKVVESSNNSNITVIESLENIKVKDIKKSFEFTEIVNIKEDKINKIMKNITQKSIVLLDFSGIYGEKIKSEMDKLKREILLVDNIKAVVVICDSLEVPFFVDVMRNIFLVRSINLDENQINKRYNHIRKKAVILKYFSGNILFKIIKKMYFKIKHITK